MSRLCPRCKTENRDGAQFCSSCSAPLGASTSTPVRYCPAGRHPMDPGWTVCPYCNAGMVSGRSVADQETHASGAAVIPPSARQATVLEAAAAGLAELSPPGPPPPPPPPPAAAAPPAAAPAAAEEPPPPPPAKRRATMFSAPEGPAAGAAPARRLAGFLVTYTWKPEGQAFPLYEGRNFVGSADDCDVALAGDPQISGRHAAILARGGEFWIDDAMSLNGTYLEGERIDDKRRLGNYASFRTGTTVWRFIAAEPPAGTARIARRESA